LPGEANTSERRETKKEASGESAREVDECAKQVERRRDKIAAKPCKISSRAIGMLYDFTAGHDDSLKPCSCSATIAEQGCSSSEHRSAL